MALELSEAGFLRLPQVLKLFPVCKSTWWAGVRDGMYPKPVKLGKRCTAWRVSDVRAMIERTGNVVGDA